VKPQAFIFDMDGVIVDSMPYHVRAWEVYLERQGRDAQTLNARMHGKHNDELLRDVFGSEINSEDIQRMGAEKEALYRELIEAELEASLVPGIREFLNDYSKMPKAVASNAEALNVNFVLERAELGGYFLHALNGQMVKYGKPHPEIYLKAAELLQQTPKDCIVFEDSQTGIDAALAAGMRVVAINSHRTTLIGQAVEADHFLDTRLHKWLEELA
jgi:beta-phosphoglucomutase family hydrolase